MAGVAVPAGHGRAHAFAERYRPFRWLVERELLRIFRLWTQTIVAPVLSSFLFIVVFTRGDSLLSLA